MIPLSSPRQKWFLYEFKGSEKDINIHTAHPEFSDYKWVKQNFLVPNIEDDWSTEYLDKKITVKIVDNIEESVEHINKYSSGHTESCLSDNQESIQYFFQNCKSAILMNNASTQFADGGEFGFGAEIGISTDKLHVRGPVGAKHLTTFKYQVTGNHTTRP